jgi:hypothetical protein
VSDYEFQTAKKNVLPKMHSGNAAGELRTFDLSKVLLPFLFILSKRLAVARREVFRSPIAHRQSEYEIQNMTLTKLKNPLLFTQTYANLTHLIHSFALAHENWRSRHVKDNPGPSCAPAPFAF